MSNGLKKGMKKMVKVTHIGSGNMLHQSFGKRGEYASSEVFKLSSIYMAVKVGIMQQHLERTAK